jgi:hypothetical protein
MRKTGPGTHNRCVLLLWHTHAIARTRVSTTVDEALLKQARRLRRGTSDAALLDEALSALVASHRAAEIDASYAAYDTHPVDEPDEWGDLGSFRKAAAES